MCCSSLRPAFALFVLCTLECSAEPRQPPRRFFSDASFWNQPLPDQPQLDPKNDHYVSLLKQEPSGGFGINLFKWTIPVYEVDATTPRYRIAKHTLSAAEHEIWQSARESFGHGPGFDDGVPIPKAALPDPEEDAHFAVVDWQAKRAWDTWGFRVRKDGSFESNTGRSSRLRSRGDQRSARSAPSANRASASPSTRQVSHSSSTVAPIAL